MNLADFGVYFSYRKLRKAMLPLHHRMIEHLPKRAYVETAKALGIYRKGSVVLAGEDDTCVLMDQCLYDYRLAGLTAVESRLRDQPPLPGSTEARLLNAMAQARYSLFRILNVRRGIGVLTEDLLFGGDIAIVDRNLSRTAAPGLTLAVRILPFRGAYHMTTGAALPLQEEVLKRLLRELHLDISAPAQSRRREDPRGAPGLSSRIIRALLRRGASERISYAEVG